MVSGRPVDLDAKQPCVRLLWAILFQVAAKANLLSALYLGNPPLVNDDFHRAITQVRQCSKNLVHCDGFRRFTMMNL